MPTPAALPVVPDRYIQALGHRDAVGVMRKAPKRFKKLLKGRSKKELQWRPAPGKWSVKEVLAHLADGEVIFGARLRFVAAMDSPPLPSYDQDLFVARLGADEVGSGELFEAFESMRVLNIGLIERLPKDALQRTGIHAERGPESIQQMITMYAGHDRIHEAQIERILVEMRQAESAHKLGKAERKAEKQAAKALAKSRKAAKPAKAPKSAKSAEGGDAEAEAAARKGKKKARRKLEAQLAGR